MDIKPTYTPIELPSFQDKYPEILQNLREQMMMPATIPVPDSIRNLPTVSEQAISVVEEGRESFITSLAERIAEENVKAARKAPTTFDKVVNALCALCMDKTYNASIHEDSMNTFVRAVLEPDLNIRDQTLSGRSERSKSAEEGNAGEIDLCIRHNGRPLCIYEGIKLEKKETRRLHGHIEKATINYNPMGVREIYVTVYAIRHSKDFGDFWNAIIDCAKEYRAPNDEYEIAWDENEEDTDLSGVRSYHGIYEMDGLSHELHIMAVKIQE